MTSRNLRLRRLVPCLVVALGLVGASLVAGKVVRLVSRVYWPESDVPFIGGSHFHLSHGVWRLWDQGVSPALAPRDCPGLDYDTGLFEFACANGIAYGLVGNTETKALYYAFVMNMGTREEQRFGSREELLTLMKSHGLSPDQLKEIESFLREYEHKS